MPANCDRARLATQPERPRPACGMGSPTPSMRTGGPPAPGAWPARAGATLGTGRGYRRPSLRLSRNHLWALAQIFCPFGLASQPDGNQTGEAALR